MNTRSTSARAVSSAFTTNPTTPIGALTAVYDLVEDRTNALERAGMSTRDKGERNQFQAAERQVWNGAVHIPVTVLFHRPETREDARDLLMWLSAALERIADQAPEGSKLETDAQAATVAVENLAVVVPALLGISPNDPTGVMRGNFNRRYFSAEVEG